MSQSAVQDILKMIDRLSESDRKVLEQHLAERVEAEWRGEAEAARGEDPVTRARTVGRSQR